MFKFIPMGAQFPANSAIKVPDALRMLYWDLPSRFHLLDHVLHGTFPTLLYSRRYNIRITSLVNYLWGHHDRSST